MKYGDTSPATAKAVRTVALAASLGSATLRKVYEIRGYNAKTSAQFIQLHDAAALPADAAVPIETITVAASSDFKMQFKEAIEVSNGAFVCNSSTQATKTIGAADCWFVIAGD